MAAFDVTTVEGVERITAAHYVDQIHAAIARCHELLDKLDGGVPAGPGAASVSGLIGDLDQLGHGSRAVAERLTEVVERLGRVL